MKLIKIDTEYYLLSSDKINVGDIYLFHKDKIGLATKEEVDENLLKFCRKIIGTTSKGITVGHLLIFIPLLNKKYIEYLLNENIFTENGVILASQQYALKESNENGVGQLTRIKNAWLDGFNTCQSYINNSEKTFTLEDMRNFAKKCCLLWNEENEISYPEMVDLEIKKITKQSEWDVEIEMEQSSYVISGGLIPEGGFGGKGLETHWSYKPKINEQGFVKIIKIK